MSGDLHDDSSAATGDEQDADLGGWDPHERALLEAALDFYGAAEGVIDLSGEDRPQVRRDAAGFEAVRRAMAALEEQVRSADGAGIAPARIAEIARIEQEIVELILSRGRAGTPSPAEG